MTGKDEAEFRAYLRNCTDRQVQGVYDKEKAAGRMDYAAMAVEEAGRRGFDVE